MMWSVLGTPCSVSNPLTSDVIKVSLYGRSRPTH